MNKNDKFWPLPAYSKLDVMTEKRHQHLIERCIRDSQTHIEKNDRYSYVVYDEKEAVIIRPVTYLLFVTLEIFRLFCNLRPVSNDSDRHS